MLRWRILLAVLIVGALAGLCWLDARAALPGLWLAPAAIVFTVTATGEALALARRAGTSPPAGIVQAANLLMVLAPLAPIVGQHCPHCQCLAALGGGGPRAGGTLSLWIMAAAMILVFLEQMRCYRQPGGVTANLSAAAFVMAYVGVMLSFAVQLRTRWGLGAVASWLITVKAGDIGAFTLGRTLGRHKIAPLLSPNKTAEGTLGAVLFSCLASWATFTWLTPALSAGSVPTGPSWGWLPFGLLMGGGGLMGDLAESLLKRDVGCKDSSRWLPGFGGVLDIVDSLLLTAPLAWACWCWGLV
jgi:phosphatidate cytidylyltransferase